jgi:hypothetical protein
VDDGRMDRFSELLVAINKSTRITLANGHRGSLSDLRTGIGVEVTGVWNNRLDEVTSTSSIAIYTLPHGKGKRKP